MIVPTLYPGHAHGPANHHDRKTEKQRKDSKNQLSSLILKILILAVRVWSSLQQRGVGLLSEMEGMASQFFEKII